MQRILLKNPERKCMRTLVVTLQPTINASPAADVSGVHVRMGRWDRARHPLGSSKRVCSLATPRRGDVADVCGSAIDVAAVAVMTQACVAAGCNTHAGLLLVHLLSFRKESGIVLSLA
eukprot:m.319018 g.319018  ORF g.319018 m.319018 type:complete len:118 (-) comp19701_c0_seq5:56-409(-)